MDYSYTGAEDHPIRNNLDPAKLAYRISLETHTSIVKVLILTATRIEELAERFSALDVVIHRHKNEDVIDISPRLFMSWKRNIFAVR